MRRRHDNCSYPVSTSPPTSSSSPGQAQKFSPSDLAPAAENSTQDPAPLSLGIDASEQESQIHSNANQVAVMLTQPSVSSAIGLPPMADLSANTMWELVRHANRAIHGAYFDDHYTILVPFLPVIAEFSPYMHTWLALGAIQIAQQQTSSAQCRWRQTAIQCYSKALQGLNQHLCSTPIPHEWALSAVLLLHIYEKFGDNHEPPSDAHVNSARSVFIRRFTQFPPSSMRHILQLESLVYRVAVTSTFRPLPNSETSYSYLDDLVEIWNSSNIPCGLWQHSLWISLPPQIFNVVFKLSVLLHMRVLGEAQMDDLDKLDGILRQYLQVSKLPPLLSVSDDGKDKGSCLSLVEQARAARCLYDYACQILIAKLRGYDATSCAIHRPSHLGFQLLAELRKGNFVSPVLLWPTIIIGLTATIPDDRFITSEYVARLEHLSGSRTISSVRLLLEHAWGELSDGGMKGVNVLSDARILASVFL